MIFSNVIIAKVQPLFFLGKVRKDDDGVDKGTNRETPGKGEGARPPKKEEYKDDDGPQAEKVDNQYKERLKKNRETRPDELIDEEKKKKNKE